MEINGGVLILIVGIWFLFFRKPSKGGSGKGGHSDGKKPGNPSNVQTDMSSGVNPATPPRETTAPMHGVGQNTGNSMRHNRPPK